MADLILLLALLWAIAVTLYAGHLIGKYDRAIAGWAATTALLVEANERYEAIMYINERWEAAYEALARRAGEDRLANVPDIPRTDLLN